MTANPMVATTTVTLNGNVYASGYTGLYGYSVGARLDRVDHFNIAVTAPTRMLLGIGAVGAVVTATRRRRASA